MGFFRQFGSAVGGLFGRLQRLLAAKVGQSVAGYGRDILDRLEDVLADALPGEGDLPGYEAEQYRPEGKTEVVETLDGGIVERHEFGGLSTDILWMEYDHKRKLLTVRFVAGRQYDYPGIAHEEFVNLIEGPGPFPPGRDPHYLKARSTGQYMNFYTRHDQADDLHDYIRTE